MALLVMLIASFRSIISKGEIPALDGEADLTGFLAPLDGCMNENLVLVLVVVIVFEEHVSPRHDTSTAEMRPIVGGSLIFVCPTSPDNCDIRGVRV
jgi:hypothetical protein